MAHLDNPSCPICGTDMTLVLRSRVTWYTWQETWHCVYCGKELTFKETEVGHDKDKR